MCHDDVARQYLAYLLDHYQHGQLLEAVEYMFGEYIHVTEALHSQLREMSNHDLADLLAANHYYEDDLLWQQEHIAPGIA